MRAEGFETGDDSYTVGAVYGGGEVSLVHSLVMSLFQGIFRRSGFRDRRKGNSWKGSQMDLLV